MRHSEDQGGKVDNPAAGAWRRAGGRPGAVQGALTPCMGEGGGLARCRGADAMQEGSTLWKGSTSRLIHTAPHGTRTGLTRRKAGT
eukprot:21063-Chlamydomonas_euryale.AAC.1